MIHLKKLLGRGVALTSLSALVVACSAPEDDDVGRDQSHAGESLEVATERLALDALSAKGTGVFGGGGDATKLSGKGLGSGSTPHLAAEDFVRRHRAALRLTDDDETTTPPPDSGTPAHVPVLFDPATSTYRFTKISYGQARDGVPVYGARLDTLVRNAPSSSVVLATSTARSLGSYRPHLRGVRVAAQKARDAIRQLKKADVEGHARTAVSPSLDKFGAPEPVIWAGGRDAPEPPRLAMTYVAESSSADEKWRIVADAETGDVLHRENLIVFEAVTGSVSAKGTADSRAPECSPPEAIALPYAALAHQGTTTNASPEGTFTLDAPSGVPLDVTSPLKGTYFVVNDAVATRLSTLTQTVTPPATIDFLHNAAASDEFTLAQVNGYVNANEVRNWVLSYHPDYPTVATQTGFAVNVNNTTGYCPGNAWYNGSSINFCASSSEYGNTSFASVSQHEYGHHLVSSAGSGQGAYGEGMADVISMLIADDPGLGYGFYKNQCQTPLRSADNTCQYSATSCSSCGSEAHACGKLLSGIVWDIREALALSDPENYRDILADLAINSILLHTGTAINAQIAVDFLTLDDDDDNISNGTPHRSAICAGFESHGIACPALLTGLQVTPNTSTEVVGEPGGPFAPSNIAYSLGNLGPNALDFQVGVNVDWLTVDVTAGSLAVGENRAIQIAINENAAQLSRGVYTGSITFDDTTDSNGPTALPIYLRVGQPSAKYTWNMDVDPGWTREGAWQFGVPQGLGSGSPDPKAGFTGQNVFGYNLAGNYTNSLPERALTTGAIDCSTLDDVSLHFRRWLNVESNRWDHARVQVSTNNTTWTTVWENGGNNLLETAWTAQEIDISSIADGQPSVYVRWTMGPTDSVIAYSGWNLDDVEIWGYGEAAPGCQADADCNDGAFCNGSERCVSGMCVPAATVPCNDGVACTVDSCNEATDACTYSPQHTACNDGLYCNGTEQCSLLGCTAGTPIVCNDGISCTVDSCNEATDSCAYSPQNTLCSNGLYCDGVETCSASLGCVAGTAPCTGGTCQESTDTCSSAPSCTDGVKNGTETDKDCGGSCSGCALGKTCAVNADCAQGTCQAGV